MSHVAPFRFKKSFWRRRHAILIVVIVTLIAAGSFLPEVTGGGTRPLTDEEIAQLHSIGVLSSKYNSLDGRDDDDGAENRAASPGGARKARCFFGSQLTPEKVPMQTWGIDPRLHYDRASSQQQSQYPQQIYVGDNPPLLVPALPLALQAKYVT